MLRSGSSLQAGRTTHPGRRDRGGSGGGHGRIRTGPTAVLAAGALTLAAVLGSVGGTGVAAAAGHRIRTAAVGPAADGVLTGNVVIRNAPAGFSGEVGVAACPAAGATAAATAAAASFCAAPQVAVAGSGASYTLVLPAGTWEVYEFYEIGFQGGAYLGHAHTVTVAAGATVRQNISVQYQAPVTVSGTVTLSGVPGGITVEALAVTACPSSQPLVGGIPSQFSATPSTWWDRTATRSRPCPRGTGCSTWATRRSSVSPRSPRPPRSPCPRADQPPPTCRRPMPPRSTEPWRGR